MKALIQRVRESRVEVDGETVGEIGPGLLVLLGVERGDDQPQLQKMADRLLAYRVFADAEGKMNLNVLEAGGSLLLVSQFTLAADTRKGLRPSFTPAAPPELAESLYEQMIDELRARGAEVATGQFAADMQVSLINDGPVTFLLET